MELKVIQVNETDWPKQGTPIQLCELPLSTAEIETLFGFTFFEFVEQGLGNYFATIISCHDSLFWLQGYGSKDAKDIGVVAWVPGDTKDKKESLAELCTCLQIKKENLNWSFEMDAE